MGQCRIVSFSFTVTYQSGLYLLYCTIFELITPRLDFLRFSFLSSISRIASRDYEPTNDDVLRARIRTLGVQEYTIPFETSSEFNIRLGKLSVV